MDSHRRDLALRNLAVWARGLPVIQELQRRGLDLIVLKSLPQVEDLYGDAAGRSSGDIDLVVRADAALAAMEILRVRGFSPQEDPLFPALARARGSENAAASRPWHFYDWQQAPPTCIDLHSDGMDPWHNPTLDPGIWEHARPANLDGVDLLLLGPEDRLLLLCWHVLADIVDSPGIPERKLVDLRLALRDDALDWPLVARRARATGSSIILHLACDLAVREQASSDHLWRRHVPAASPRRLALLQAYLDRRGLALTGYERYLLSLLAHDRPTRLLPLWREMLLPTRAALADRDESLPSWPRYSLLVARVQVSRVSRLWKAYRAR